MAGMGLVGFLDDFIKISKQRSLGLDAKAKIDPAGHRRHPLCRAGAELPERRGPDPGVH